MSISFSGLASGLDTSSWIQSLTALKQAKVTVLQKERETVLFQKDTLSSIRSFFASFRSTIEKITDAKFNIASMNLFAQNLATSTDLKVLTATATEEAKEGTYEIKVDKLATSTKASSRYNYLTTTIDTKTAVDESLLINLSYDNGGGREFVQEGVIGVTVNGVERSIVLKDTDTMTSFVEKLKEIGVDANYNVRTGVFTANISASDINDYGNTGIVHALHLEGVNEGYLSNNLTYETVDPTGQTANGGTKLVDLGVNTGTITVAANSGTYNFTIDANTSMQNLLDWLHGNNITADLKDGIFTLEDAEITNDGTTGLIDAFGLNNSVIYSNSQKSDELVYNTTITESTTATLGTKLADIGNGITVTDGMNVIVKNSSGEEHSIAINANSTIGDLLTGMNNAGLSAVMNSDGTIEISGGTITGGTFDAIDALGLNSEPFTAMVSGNALNETIEVYELVTLQTCLVDDMGVKEGYLSVTDAAGSQQYLKIYSGQTIADLMTDLANYGIYSDLDESTGILTITGGDFATMTDADVLAKIADGSIVETEARYKQGTDLLTALYGAATISVQQTSVSQTYARSRALTYETLHTIDASLTTTLGQLGLTANETATFNVRGETRNVAVTTDMTIQGLMDALAAQGIESSFSEEHSKITIENANITSGTGAGTLGGVLGLTTEVSGKYISSGVAKFGAKNTVVVEATRDTTFKELGVTGNNSVYLIFENGLRNELFVGEDTTLGSFIDDINSRHGVSASLVDGVLKIEGGYIDNAAIVNALGLDREVIGYSNAVGSYMATTTEYADETTTIEEICGHLEDSSFIKVKGPNGNDIGTITVDDDTTIGGLLTALAGYGISGSINRGVISLTSAEGIYAVDDTSRFAVLDALGIGNSAYSTVTTTTTSAVSQTSTLIVSVTKAATVDTKFKDIGITGTITTGILCTRPTEGNNASIITTGEMTIGDFFAAIAEYGMQGSITNGVVNITNTSYYEFSGDGLYSSFNMDPNGTSTTVNKTVGNTAIGSAKSYNVTTTSTILYETTVNVTTGAYVPTVTVTTTDETRTAYVTVTHNHTCDKITETSVLITTSSMITVTEPIIGTTVVTTKITHHYSTPVVKTTTLPVTGTIPFSTTVTKDTEVVTATETVITGTTEIVTTTYVTTTALGTRTTVHPTADEMIFMHDIHIGYLCRGIQSSEATLDLSIGGIPFEISYVITQIENQTKAYNNNFYLSGHYDEEEGRLYIYAVGPTGEAKESNEDYMRLEMLDWEFVDADGLDTGTDYQMEVIGYDEYNGASCWIAEFKKVEMTPGEVTTIPLVSTTIVDTTTTEYIQTTQTITVTTTIDTTLSYSTDVVYTEFVSYAAASTDYEVSVTINGDLTTTARDIWVTHSFYVPSYIISSTEHVWTTTETITYNDKTPVVTYSSVWVDTTGTLTVTTWRTITTTGSTNMTGDSKLSQLGMTSEQTVSVYSDGTVYTVNFQADDTVDDVISSLAGLGIHGSINGGALTLKGDKEAYITYMGAGLRTALGYTDRQAFSTTDTYYASNLTSYNTYSVTNTMTTDDTFSELNITGGWVKVYSVEDGLTYSINVAGSDTVDDFLTTLAGYGISGSVSDGKITLHNTGDKEAYITAIDSTFANALKITSTGSNYYTTSSPSVTYSANDTSNTLTCVSVMTDDTTLSELGITGGNFTIYRNGITYTHSLATTNSIADFRQILSNYNINSEIFEGKLVLNADGNVFLNDETSNVTNKLGIDQPMWNTGSYSQISKDLTDTSTVIVTATMDRTLAELTDIVGNNMEITNGAIYVYNDGTRNQLSIDINDTLSTLASKLSTYGITMSINQFGQISFYGDNDSYLTTYGLSSDIASNILSRLNVSGGWAEIYDSTSKKLQYEITQDSRITGDTKMTDLQDDSGNSLGITEGEFTVISNGVRTNETITADTTVDDFIATMARYGMVAEVDSSGAITVGGQHNSYLLTSNTGYDTSAIATLFAQWNFTNIYTSNNIAIPDDVTVAITETTKLADINPKNYQDGYITVVKDGVQTHISLTADDTVGTLLNELEMYGFQAVVNDGGQVIIKATGNSTLQNYVGAEQASNILDILGIGVANWVSTNTYDGEALDVNQYTTTTAEATRDTLLSDLVALQAPGTKITGEYYIYKDGVKYTALISSDETVGSFLDTLATYGIEANIVSTGTAAKLEIVGAGNTYIEKSASTNNASDVPSILFPDGNDVTKYAYESDEKLGTAVTTNISATEDTKLTDLDINWTNGTPNGKLSVLIDGEENVINITSNDTVGTLMEKFRSLGLEVSLDSDGKIMIQSGYKEFDVNAAGSTTEILNDMGWNWSNDLGGYVASNDECEATTTTIENRTDSVASWADNATELNKLNVTAGSFTVYRNGLRATVTVEEGDTFTDLQNKINKKYDEYHGTGRPEDLANLNDDIVVDFNNGYLKIYSASGASLEVGSSSDTSNIASICGFSNDGSGTISSARELYKINGQTKLMESGVFRLGDVTAGAFTIGDEVFYIDDSTTLQGIMSQINASEKANTSAYWDSIEGKIVLASRSEGSSFINIEAGSSEAGFTGDVSNFTDILCLTKTENLGAADQVTRINVENQEVGSNAIFSINGTTYTSTGNVIKSDISKIEGVTINLKGVNQDGATTTLTIEKDKETVANAVSDIVDAYNELIENVDKEIAQGGTLSDQFSLKLLRNEIRSLMSNTFLNTGVFKNMDSIGISADKAVSGNIDTSRVNVLNFDKNKFLDAFDSDLDSLQTLLVGNQANGYKGVLTSIENAVERALDGGYFTSADKSYDTKIQRLNTKISKAEKAVEVYRARLENKFQSMDLLISNIQNQYSSFLS